MVEQARQRRVREQCEEEDWRTREGEWRERLKGLVGPGEIVQGAGGGGEGDGDLAGPGGEGGKGRERLAKDDDRVAGAGAGAVADDVGCGDEREERARKRRRLQAPEGNGLVVSFVSGQGVDVGHEHLERFRVTGNVDSWIQKGPNSR